ncbi:MAG: hypothetical protein ACNS60_09385 [Candidatus Cyclobacteriaceae bacterium M2_1C_046]
MQNFKKLKFGVILLFPLALYISSCEESNIESLQNNVPFESLPQEKQIMVVESNLIEAANGFSSIASSEEMRNTLYKKLEEQKDGEYSGLLREIVTDPAISSKIKLSSSFTQVLDEFENMDEMKYYPQIYIPFYEDLKN